MPRIPPELCTRCKGYRLLCGLPSCPILDRLRSQARSLERAGWSQELHGSTPPSILVGERGYPGVDSTTCSPRAHRPRGQEVRGPGGLEDLPHPHRGYSQAQERACRRRLKGRRPEAPRTPVREGDRPRSPLHQACRQPPRASPPTRAQGLLRRLHQARGPHSPRAQGRGGGEP